MEASPTGVLDFDSTHSRLERNNVASEHDASIPPPTIHNGLDVPNVSVTPFHQQRSGDTQTHQVPFFDMESKHHVIRHGLTKEKQKLNESSSFSVNEIKHFKDTASNLAMRGKENKALEIYNTALEMARIGLKQTSFSNRSDNDKSNHIMAAIAADICTDMANLYARGDNYTKAISLCNEAREMYHTYFQHQDFCRCVDKIFQRIKQYQKAKNSNLQRNKLLQHVREMHKKTVAVNDPTTKLKMYQRVTKTLYEIIQLECDSLGESHPNLARTIGLLGTVNLEMNHVDTALEQYETALSILRTSLGPLHPKTGAALSDIAAVYHSYKRDSIDLNKKVLQYYSEAIMAFRESCGACHFIVGSTLNKIADVYIDQEQYNLAVETLNDALAVYETIQVDSGGVHPGSAHVWRSLGNVYCRRKDWEVAIVFYTTALKIQMADNKDGKSAPLLGDCSDSKKTDLSDQQCLADTHEKLGRATAAVGRNNEAIKVYEDALRIRQAAMDSAESNRENNHLSVRHAQGCMAYTLRCIAKVHQSEGNITEALSYYGRSLKLSHAIENGVECAIVLAGIGSVHLQNGDFKKAVLILQGTERIFEKNGACFTVTFKMWLR